MTPTEAYILLILFAIAMVATTSFLSKERVWHTTVGFMAAGRQVNWVLGAVSIAVSWIWAPALFVSVQQAYQQGLPGLAWFVLPNIICLFIMAPLARRIRLNLPAGYTQPEWIRARFDEKTHKLYMFVFFWYQLMAVTVQLYAGGSIFALLTGVRVETVMLVLATTTLAYGMISGMRASIITDFIQYALILVGGLVIIPWTISAAGGTTAITGGIGGVGGAHPSLFDKDVALNFGIITTIGLISGVLSDQQHWQRAFTIRQKDLQKAYFLAGILFGIVPISLGLLGFLAANPVTQISLPPGTDPSMIGVAAVAKYLTKEAVILFIVMLLAGLCSTLDSGLCAASSLFAMNCVKFTDRERQLLETSTRPDADQTIVEERQALDKRIVKLGRIAMVVITLAGLAVSFSVLYIPGFGLKYLWWIFNTVAACVAIPTVLSLYWNRLDAKGVFLGVLIAFVLGVPAFVYANMNEINWLSITASVGIIVVTTIFCLAFPRKEPFRLATSGAPKD